MGVGGQRHALATLPPGKRPGTPCIGGWMGPRTSVDDAENLFPTRIRSLDHPACGKLLY
jgi:hypothetical protein